MFSLANLLHFFILLAPVLTQTRNRIVPVDNQILKWCVIGEEERHKCADFSNATRDDALLFGADFMIIECINGTSKDDCMHHIDIGVADVASLDSGDLFTGGRFYSLKPILQEVYQGNVESPYAVAVLKKGTLSDVSSLRHLRGKKGCFPGVGTLAGWTIPFEIMRKHGGMDIIDCNNDVKTASKFFGPSCAVHSLQDKYNPIGDNPDKLCHICAGEVGYKCSDSDPYASYTGAFRCLLEAGEIAFLKHTTVGELAGRSDFPTVSKDDFELLCIDGSRRPIDSFRDCNWGKVLSNVVVTSTSKSPKDVRLYQRFLKRAVELYGTAEKRENRTSNDRSSRPWESNYNTPTTPTPQSDSYFRLFESAPKYGNRYDLLLQDVAVDLITLDDSKQSYENFLGKELFDLLSLRKCPVESMSLCVTSEYELAKCSKMKLALKAKLLKPDLTCYLAHSHIHCMQAIRNGDADVAVFDAGDVYTAGLRYDLIPFMSEIYDNGTPDYYAVAISKEEDLDTMLTYLKGKDTCHTGINTAAGWVIPLAFIISNGWMRSYGCDSVRSAAELFSKSCVPGAISSEYNTGVPYDQMCHLCHGSSFRYCRRDANEDYYGHTGAFRCLIEGGGQVAFVKHTTINENTGGRKKSTWARNMLVTDFQLLCPDGTRALAHQYKTCNLGKVKSNAIVTRGGDGYNQVQINAYINLFLYAQQFYGSKTDDDSTFSMFTTREPYADLIFQDATLQLLPVPKEQREYSAYLGQDFMRAKRIVDCHAFAPGIRSSPLLTGVMIILSTSLGVLFSRN